MVGKDVTDQIRNIPPPQKERFQKMMLKKKNVNGWMVNVFGMVIKNDEWKVNKRKK